MGPEVTLAVYGVLMPAVLAAAVLAGAGIARPRDATAPGPAGAAALGVAFAGAYLAGNAWTPPRFPAVAFHEWLAWCAVPAVVLGALEPAPGARRWWWGVRAIAAIGLVVLLLWTPLRQTWSAAAGAAWVLAATAAVLAMWGPLARLAPGLGALVAAVTAGTGGLALALTGSGLLGTLGVALGSAAGVAWALGTWQPRFAAGRGLAAPVACLLGGALASGAYYSELPWGLALLLTAVPLAALAAPISRQ